MKTIRATVSEGDRMWYAHGETREEALHHLRIAVKGEIRSGFVTFEEVGPDADPHAKAPASIAGEGSRSAHELAENQGSAGASGSSMS